MKNSRVMLLAVAIVYDGSLYASAADKKVASEYKVHDISFRTSKQINDALTQLANQKPCAKARLMASLAEGIAYKSIEAIAHRAKGEESVLEEALLERLKTIEAKYHDYSLAGLDSLDRSKASYAIEVASSQYGVLAASAMAVNLKGVSDSATRIQKIFAAALKEVASK